MRNRKAVVIGGVAVLALVGGLLAFWVERDGGGGEAEGAFGEATEMLPADTEIVRYVDRDAAAAYAGVDDIGHGADSDEIDTYLGALQGSSWISTPLASYLAVMEDAPYNELDVDWWASVEIGDAAPLNVYRMDDELDLDALADSFADVGMDESELDGHRRFKAGPDAAMDENGLIDGTIPVSELTDVTVLEEQHLLVVGAEPERVVDVVDGDADALADVDGLTTLTDQVGSPPLYALAFLGSDAGCGGQLERALGTASPEVAEELRSQSGIDELGTPDARGLFVVAGDDHVDTVAVLEFESEDAAAQDAEARQVWVADGTDPVTRQPNALILDAGEVTADGTLVVADAAPDPVTAIQTSDTGFGLIACTA